jgi:predicted dithiol-disulfide oxidoreductase (DUF899 family)
VSLPEVTTREEWLVARKELPAREKAMTKLRDALNADRRTRPSRTDSSASVLEDWAGSAVEIDGRACHVRRAIGQEISRQVGELC